jgi:hypothetical protein
VVPQLIITEEGKPLKKIQKYEQLCLPVFDESCRIFCSKQGDQMSLWKNRPKGSPTQFFVKINAQPFTWKIVTPKMLKANCHPMCENSPNLVTLDPILRLRFTAPALYIFTTPRVA